jgi:hypothetical protein
MPIAKSHKIRVHGEWQAICPPDIHLCFPIVDTISPINQSSSLGGLSFWRSISYVSPN